MSTAVFPSLPGLSITVNKQPTMSTNIAEAVSGREVRMPNWLNPIWEFELSFEGLSDSANSAVYQGLGAQSLQTLQGFFLIMQRAADTFLYVDPVDNTVTNGVIGTGDGTSTIFTAVRALGDFVEPVGHITDGTIGIAINGTPEAGGGGITIAGNQITFSTAPAAGAIITASFQFAFVCRFDDDKPGYTQLWNGVWQNQSLKFKSVLQ